VLVAEAAPAQVTGWIGATVSVTTPQQMYPIGLLFGLGVDTATEVALLVIAASAGAAGLPWYAILRLPILFAAGMSLLDSIDGSFMNFAYGWAFSKLVRKVFYNIMFVATWAIALSVWYLGVHRRTLEPPPGGRSRRTRRLTTAEMLTLLP
jgi:HoxN/HupN/NixA family high-affinity nickel-transporter